MIGGKDIMIPTRAGQRALDLAMRLAMRVWREPVFEDATNETRYKRYEEIPLDQLSEVLVYRDGLACDSWDELGAAPELVGTLIHLILGHDSLTVVVDEDAPAPIVQYVSALQAALRQDILNVDAIRRAA